jgi:hypothetical protein
MNATRRGFGLVLLWLLFSWSVALYSLLACPDPDPPPDVTPGRWLLEYGAGDGVVTLEGRDYYCDWSGSRWAGTWSWDRQNRILSVTEWMVSIPERETTWTVILNRDLKGAARTGCGVEVRVRLRRTP